MFILQLLVYILNQKKERKKAYLEFQQIDRQHITGRNLDQYLDIIIPSVFCARMESL